MKLTAFFVPLLICSLILGMQTAQATEGASSHYFPGSSTTFASAAPPAPGLMAASQTLYYNGRADTAVLGGAARLGLKAEAIYDYVGAFYTFKKPVLGGRLQIGAAAPVGHTSVKADIGTTNHAIGTSDSRTNVGDAMVSAALYWKKGDIHYKLTEAVFIPTGGYNADNLANVGRNYWSFDTSLTMMWMNHKAGTEISITPGIMFNTANKATDYKSGNEFHVDFAVNKFLSPEFAVGLHGYYYRQVSGDSGSGAVLGSFKGESFGVGPAILWMPKSQKGNLSVVAKWIKDTSETKRMHGDYGQLSVAYKF